MKKILLSITLITAAYFSQAQAVLNEIYFNPSTGESEYFEVYNSGANDDMNCYTLLSMYDNGTTKGFYVINFPAYTLNSNTFSVGTSSTTGSFNYQAGVYTLSANDFSWNSLNAPGSGGYFKQYQLNAEGTGYIQVAPPTNTNDIFNTLPSGAGAKYITLLYRNGVITNGLVINGTTNVSPTALKTTMPPLTVPTDGVCQEFTITFSNIQGDELEYLTPAIGNSNGAFRTSDGKCGTWNKAANKTDNTPGSSNGPSSVITGEIGVSGQLASCEINLNNTRNAIYSLVLAETNIGAYPLTLQLYQDNGSVPGQLDAGDAFVEQQIILTQPATQLDATFQAEVPSPAKNLIVIAKSTAGCFQTIEAISSSCSPLPVKLKSFTASRKQTNVELKWTTTLEQNNSGFELQRQSGAGGWQKIAFVNSKATDGNSVSDLHYSYTDVNDSRGVSQYRLMQVDLDDNAKYSEIRSVQGIGQEARTIISPNPTANGRVNVTFQSANSKKDLQLTDMHGRMLKQWNAYSDNSLLISDLTPGIYQLRIVDRETGTQTVEKIMVVNR